MRWKSALRLIRGSSLYGNLYRIEKTVIHLLEVPSDLVAMIDGSTWKPITIGHSEASTYLLEGMQDNYYLKVQRQGSA
ncbi:hypothetical protein H9649_15335 [Sporosarcina sp. Sa2YVA2]|uniref:Uncharacterized protein n=1 Tax=Sporosarcina quadrami TaxID=2762234 RepID=A0ABR8UD28_9BACL|nr:hypothetical protein [Sporosarcina quadrami]